MSVASVTGRESAALGLGRDAARVGVAPPGYRASVMLCHTWTVVLRAWWVCVVRVSVFDDGLGRSERLSW